jgi:hypothetical protein
MNPRERLLAICLVAVILLFGGGGLYYYLVLGPLQKRTANIRLLEKDIETKEKRIAEIKADLPRLERWRQLSLPADVDVARREYEKYLTSLLQKSGFAQATLIVTPKPPDVKTVPQLPGKGPIYTRLTYTVAGSANLADLVKALNQFHHTSLLHQIRNLAIRRPLTANTQQRQGDLDINFTVEALIVTGAGRRSELLPGVNTRLLVLDVVTALRRGPTGVALAPWTVLPTGPLGPGTLADPPRNYAAIAGKDIFMGPPPPRLVERTTAVNVSPFVYLTDITRSDRDPEAFLYDRYNNRKTRLRASAGFNSFTVRDDQGETLVQGKVVRIDEREVIFVADEKYYAMHVGDNLGEAMRKELSKDRLKDLGLAAAEKPPATGERRTSAP